MTIEQFDKAQEIVSLINRLDKDVKILDMWIEKARMPHPSPIGLNSLGRLSVYVPESITEEILNRIKSEMRSRRNVLEKELKAL